MIQIHHPKKQASPRIGALLWAGLGWVLGAMLCLAQGAMAAGRDVVIEFTAGNVIVQTGNGQSRAAQAGDALLAGETVVTGQGRVQIRFSDDGVVDLAPGSAFRVDDYFYAGSQDGNERKFMTLIHGLLRTISGAIGHNHLENYRLDTPVASIGIRGTGYTAQYNTGLTVEVGEGAVVVANQAGSLLVDRGQAGFVRDLYSPPVLTPRLNRAGGSDQQTNQSTAPLAADGTKVTGKADPRTPNGEAKPADNSSPTTTSPNQTAQIQVGGSMTSPGPVANADVPTAATTLVSGKNGKQVSTTSSVAQNDAGNGIGWSRWTSADGSSVVHLLTGTPQMVLPKGGMATYTVDGGSGPASANGQIGQASGSMIVNFAGLRSTLGVDLNFAMADGASYRMTSTGGLSATDRSQIALGANGVFKGDALSIAGTGANNACAAATCQGSVMGFFAGTAAERAALAYGIAVVPDAKNLAQQAHVAPTSMATPTTVLSGVATLGKQGPVVTNVTSTIPTTTPAPKN